jgi:CheY-like chemotaxis protein
VERRRERETVPATSKLDGVHVLAVDDEEDTLTLLREILEGAGAAVTTVTSAEEALDMLHR